jgi:FKBP-type peptidyl-prolyl cis-trans isomerase 2
VPHFNDIKKERIRTMSKVENGQTVSVHYVGTLEDGTEFDSSRTREEPLAFQVGSGQLIAGFNNAVMGMTMGETKTISLEPSDAYGVVDPSAVHSVPTEMFPGDFKPVIGATVVGQNEQGEKMMAKIETFDEEGVTLDFNHPMAGKTLNFEIELISID